MRGGGLGEGSGVGKKLAWGNFQGGRKIRLKCKSSIAENLFFAYLDSMKTTIDIPDQALADAMRFTGAKTKREAVVKAIEDYNRQQKVKQLVSSLGTWDIATNEEIEAGDLLEMESLRNELPKRS